LYRFALEPPEFEPVRSEIEPNTSHMLQHFRKLDCLELFERLAPELEQVR